MKHMYLKRLILITLVFISSVAIAQIRKGAIDLDDSYRHIVINHDGSGNTLGVEGGSFSVEGWVYMLNNTGDDFNFFRFVSGSYTVCLSYNGDPDRNGDQPWYVETKNLPEKGNGAEWNWNLDYKSGFSAPVFEDSWHHVAFTCNDRSTVRLFIDGEDATGSVRLTDNGTSLVNLFPNGGDGKCEIGGGSINKGIRGDFYLGEFRLWDTQLTTTEVSTYYNEEVNASHPHWNDLIRYYHGTESSGTGSARTFEDRSPTNKYNATVSGSDVSIISTFSPPVRPPSFNNLTFDEYISVNTCQLSDIDVSWSNVRATGTSNYTSHINSSTHNYYIEVTRDSDGKVISDGTATSASDADVSEGFLDRYILKTYWEIDGTKYYADLQKNSSYGSIKDQYEKPTDFTVTTTNCDESIDLDWSASDGTPPNWTIQKSVSPTFASVAGTAIISGSTTAYSSINQSVETNLYYRVYASGTDDNGCTVSGDVSDIGTGYTSKPPSAPTGVTITQDLPSKTLILNWTNPSGNNADSWIIKRDKFEGGEETQFTASLATTSYSDNALELCQTYSYTLGAVNECETDGVFATTSVTENISTDLSGAITGIEASKGYLPGSVQIEWELNGSLSNIDRFRLYRSKADKNNFSLIKVLDNDLIYSDETALGGVFYNYKVVGEAACEDQTIFTNEGIDMGFVLPYGVANGHVEYEGGNAVEGVRVDFEKQAGPSGHSLELDGVDDYVLLDEDVKINNTSFTIEFWQQKNSSSGWVFGTAEPTGSWNNKALRIGYVSSTSFAFEFWASNLYYYHTTDNEWHHWACVYDKDATGNNRFIYKDGVLVASNTASSDFIGTQPLAIGRAAKNTNYAGHIDEVRVWNVARSADEIELNHDRVLNGTEDGLMVYYRCDEGIGGSVYDASQTDDEFNKNDGVFVNDVVFSDEIPSQDQFGIRGVTDEYGDYTINYIPYQTSGEIFRVTPSFGQHAFQPNSRTVYVGDGAKTQNGLDFTDISSFTVTGKVSYENSQVPVENVEILIDGINAVGADNQVVRTDENGDYSLNVPIGYHYISTRLEGHTFAEGYFPALSSFGDIQKFEFTEDLTVNFTDATKIKVAGRIVGGTIEGNKTIGFGLSLNNVGVADLTLRLVKEGYDIDLADASIYDAITIITDPYSGEYELELIPEKWIVETAGNSNYFIDPEDIPTLDFSNSLEDIIVYDTTDNNGVQEVISYTYNHLLNYIIRSTPVIEVYDDQWGPFDGDTSFLVYNEAIELFDTVQVGDNGLFEHPIFQQGSTYGVNVVVKEYYSNSSHPDGAVLDEVPVKGGNVTITDNLAYYPENNTGVTGSDGVFQYDFLAGKPNLSTSTEESESYTKTFRVDVEINGVTISWPSDEAYRAYLLGALAVDGTDFVSFGPEVVEMVLRDPPGSNSYAFIEKGSSYKKAETWGMNQNTNQGMKYNSFTGPKTFISPGAAPGPIVMTEAFNKSELGLTISRDIDYDGSYTEEWTFNERFETSSDPEDVGSDADVYLGKAYNAFVTQTKNLGLLTKDYCIQNGLEYYEIPGSEYVIGVQFGFSMDEGNTSTYFAYTQRHIQEELIPDLLLLRDDLLESTEYEVKFPWGHQFYGIDNDDNSESWQQYIADTLAQNPSADTTQLSYVFTPSSPGTTDSVAFLNQQIGMWLTALAVNEAEKATAEVIKNLSFDGSGGKISEEVTETYSSEYNWNSQRKVKLDWNSSFGLTINGLGSTLQSSFDLNVNMARGEDAQNSHSVKFGYVIDEDDEGDYYSIDVKNTKGISILNRSKFADNIPSKSEFIEDQLTRTLVAGGVVGVKAGLMKTITHYAGTKLKPAGVAAIAFAFDAALFTYELVDVTSNALKTYDKQDGVGSTFDISGFSISSPIFSVRGGQSRCPYEGEEVTSLYVDDSGNEIPLHTATLLREKPVISSDPATRNDVPENESAVFILFLQNESESNSNMWYDVSIDEASNPNGAVLLIDGLTAERSFLVPAGETLEKTLTIQQGATGELNYDSIAIILHSTCQFDPTSSQDDIGDTVFVSAHFLPACASIELGGFNENWILNYDDNDQALVTLSGYDVNHPTLEKLDFQFKTLSGSPIPVKGYFKDTAVADYATYGDNAELIDGHSTLSFTWDIKDLTDRQYQVRARATCADGSETTTDYLLGRIDRETPTAFGSPKPADGILDPSDDVLIRFNESLEEGLIKDHNISVRSVLNGADVTHGTSVKFNGSNNHGRIPSVSLNNKPFTIEYWLKRDAGTVGTVLMKGSGDDLLKVVFNIDETISLYVGDQVFTIDPSSYYTAVAPVNSWHHWAVTYDNSTDKVSMIMDDQLVYTKSDVVFSPRNAENLYVGRNSNGSEALEAQVHEMRIWAKSLSVSQTVATMNVTLTGKEVGLYGYWPMNEGNGTQALDKSASRHMALNAAWELFPGSESFAFNGVDQFLTLDGKNVVITEETDFTVEFWFKTTTPTSAQTFFSSGRGDLSDTVSGNEAYALSINAMPSGQIEVQSNGTTFTAATTNYLDNQWHHFALVVDRQSTVRSYVDGVVQKALSNAGFNGVAGTSLWLGVRTLREDQITLAYDQYFDGSMDEFRIWNSARNSDLIALYQNSKLEGDELGLIAYLPFEEYNDVMGTIVRSATLSDEAEPQFLTQANAAIATGGESFADGASITDVRPVQDIPFDFVSNDDEIIITPLIDASRIEGQIIEFSVSDVFDLYGNRQLSTVSWTAYAQQNEVIWSENEIQEAHTPGTATAFTGGIVNKGGVDYSYTIENLPAWLTASPSSGTISPNSTVEVKFTINEGLNVGYYEQNINLSTSLGFDEQLAIKVTVAEEAPDWTFDTEKYEYSMNIFGRLLIEDVVSTDINDIVGVFVDDEVRGVAQVEYVPSLDAYLVFITAYSNEVNNEEMEFRVWDASEGRIHEEVNPELTFLANAIIGSSAMPQDINASNSISTTLTLNTGWTWISANLESSKLATVDSIFSEVGQDGDLVKGQDAFDIYDVSTGWFGNLTVFGGGIQVEEMYKVFLTEGADVKYSGVPVDVLNTAITVDSGWNYVGYTPQVKMSIEEALVGMSPNSGDLMKSQKKFAMYDDVLGWIGSLKNLSPNEGYMLMSASSTTLIYPENSSLSSAKIAEEQIDLPEGLTINTNQYADNMSLIAQLDKGANYSLTGDEVLVVFVGSEPRGYTVATSLSNGEYVFFLTVYGELTEELRFELFDQLTGETISIENKLSYEVNEIIGTPGSPYALRVEEKGTTATNGLTVLPNPFSTEIEVGFGCQEGMVEVYDVLGVPVASEYVYGTTTIDLSASLRPGAYLVKVNSACGVFTEQIVKY